MEMPDADQTSSNKEKINCDAHPGEAAVMHQTVHFLPWPRVVIIIIIIIIIYFCLIALYTFYLTDGAECNVQLSKPGPSVAARLLAVIEDLEQAHATFQRREIEEGTSVILNL